MQSCLGDWGSWNQSQAANNISHHAKLLSSILAPFPSCLSKRALGCFAGICRWVSALTGAVQESCVHVAFPKFLIIIRSSHYVKAHLSKLTASCSWTQDFNATVVWENGERCGLITKNVILRRIFGRLFDWNVDFWLNSNNFLFLY